MHIFERLPQLALVSQNVVEALVEPERARSAAQLVHSTGGHAAHTLHDLAKLNPLAAGGFEWGDKQMHVIGHHDNGVNGRRLPSGEEAAFHHDVALGGRERAAAESECDEVGCARPLDVREIAAGEVLVLEKRKLARRPAAR
jgi:hypothetical protein